MIDIEKIMDAQKAWRAAASQGDRTAREAASEALSICVDSIEILRDHLNIIGYPWAKIEKISIEDLTRNIARIEKAIGTSVPQILVLFWEKVGGISFVDLDHYHHTEFWMEHHLTGPKFFCDGLHVDPANDEWTEFTCNDYIDWLDYREPGDTHYLISLSPDGYHKDNISGGAPYGVKAGQSWIPTWQNFEWTGVEYPITASADTLDFLSYLRTTVLECAGFPALLGSPGFNPIRDQLLQGVPVF